MCREDENEDAGEFEGEGESEIESEVERKFETTLTFPCPRSDEAVRRGVEVEERKSLSREARRQHRQRPQGSPSLSP